jgi:hypothetical protein
MDHPQLCFSPTGKAPNRSGRNDGGLAPPTVRADQTLVCQKSVFIMPMLR